MKEILNKILKWGTLGLFLIQTFVTSESDSFRLVPYNSKAEEKTADKKEETSAEG